MGRNIMTVETLLKVDSACPLEVASMSTRFRLVLEYFATLEVLGRRFSLSVTHHTISVEYSFAFSMTDKSLDVCSRHRAGVQESNRSWSRMSRQQLGCT